MRLDTAFTSDVLSLQLLTSIGLTRFFFVSLLLLKFELIVLTNFSYLVKTEKQKFARI